MGDMTMRGRHRSRRPRAARGDRIRGGVVALAAALAGALAGCSSSHPATSAPTPPPTQATPPSTAPASTVPARSPSIAPPTTKWAPTAPQTSPDAAAAALVSAWATGNRAMAATVASPAAVAALFAAPYPGPDLAISRGCSAGFPPLVCTYGPPGGAAPTDSIYEISVTQAPTGWYVSSVMVLT